MSHGYYEKKHLTQDACVDSKYHHVIGMQEGKYGGYLNIMLLQIRCSSDQGLLYG